MRRTPRFFDGTELTNREIGDLLWQVVRQIERTHAAAAAEVLGAWPEIAGPHISAYSRAERFSDGVLTVKVKSSTLLNALRHGEKERLLADLQKKLPEANIRELTFRIG
jgi:predicted nucleic acid-binding Zn ribbon protein